MIIYKRLQNHAEDSRCCFNSVSVTPTEGKSFDDAYASLSLADREAFYIISSFSAGGGRPNPQESIRR